MIDRLRENIKIYAISIRRQKILNVMCYYEGYSNILAWKIPWMEECGRLQSIGSQRVGHN